MAINTTHISTLVKKAEILARNNDLESAYDLLVKAESMGSPLASYALGTWFLFGKYVSKDLEKAFSYFSKSAKKGNSDAIFNLAICYEKGAGVDKDLKKAFHLYVQAFESGDFDAAYEVGRMLYYGFGVSKNQSLAYFFINLSKTKKLPSKRLTAKKFSKPSKSSSFQIA